MTTTRLLRDYYTNEDDYIQQHAGLMPGPTYWLLKCRA
jgi:hypothetical protein